MYTVIGLKLDWRSTVCYVLSSAPSSSGAYIHYTLRIYVVTNLIQDVCIKVSEAGNDVGVSSQKLLGYRPAYSLTNKIFYSMPIPFHDFYP